MKPITIYVVDDYLLTRIAHKRYFSSNSEFKIMGDFSNAKDCLEAMEVFQPDIIIMDIELPNINGIEATKIIKEKYPKTKVIMFTSFATKERISASLACGACGFVLKNNEKENLKQIIKKVMQNKFQIDLEIAKTVFSSLPRPNTKDLENLYENKKLKKRLTSREIEVLKLLITGKTNSQIAHEMLVSTNTAKAHVGNILVKLSVKDRVQAAVKAIKANIV